MTCVGPSRDRKAPPSAPTQPLVRVLTRREASDRLLRVCDAILWSMARRKMH